ncbi:MAG: helix-turn-helix domain-containing protein [bacterium]|nr:helix-turn-helix domain-containing protein [bacterium]MDE0242798.1 helix-turn-helix domain-containing protein [bacterium]
MTNEKYHYVECGLDYIYLANGFRRFDSRRGPSIAIRDVDALHQAIGQHICDQKKDLSGQEIRFLRRELLMSQASLARILGVKEQTVHRWEAGKTTMPKAAESILRVLYMEQIKASSDGLRSTLKRIADLEDEIHHREEMIFRLKSNRQAQPSGGDEPASGQWALAA